MKFSLIPAALAFLAAAFSGVRAQNVSECVLDCIGQAAAANNCDLTNTQCLCTDSALQQAALSCLQKSCTAQDLQNAESLVQTECAAFSSIPLNTLTSATGSGTATNPSANQTQTQTQGQSQATQSQSQSQNAAAPTAYARKVGATVVAVAVGAVVGL